MELELNNNDLYITGTVYEYEDGTSELLRKPILFENHSTNIYHTVTQFDRLDTLAWKYWKEKVEDASKYWWVIADANEIYNPLDLKDYIGKRIVIPDILRVLVQI